MSVEASINCRHEFSWRFVPAVETERWVKEWDRLNERSFRSPLLQSWFLLPALDRFGTGGESVAIGERKQGAIAAMVLLKRPARLRCEGFQPSQTPLATALVDPGESVAAVTRSLIRALPAYVLAVTLLHLDERFMAMPSPAYDLEITPRFETGSIAIAPDFSDYYAQIPIRARKNLERRIRKATTEVGPVCLDVWTAPDRIDEFLRLYSNSEMRGWKGTAGSAVRLDDTQGRFYRDLLQAAAKTQALRMFILRFGERPAAQQIAIEFDGITYFLKTTYDEALAPYAPGVIQRYMILQWSHAQSPSVRNFEIYGQIKEAIAPFVTGRRFIFHLTVLRHGALRSPLERLRSLRRLVGSVSR